MSEKQQGPKAQQGPKVQQGPKAPTDPVEKAERLYIMMDAKIAGTPRENGLYQDICYLHGRLVDKARITSGVEDENILSLLNEVRGLRKLIFGIGVSFSASNTRETVNFNLCFSASNGNGSEDTHMKANCSLNGEETFFFMEDYADMRDEDILVSMEVTFQKANQTAEMTVSLLLKDGFHVPPLIIDKPVDFSTLEYQQLLNRSILQAGNNYRLKSKLEKINKGEDITLAFIGGSITQGAAAKPIHENCYARLVYEDFKRKYETRTNQIHFCKAGIGGTSSELGLLRYDKDICKFGEEMPDIVFVEFAVNDEGDETNGVCYESLVKKILESAGSPAVILVFSVFMNDWNLQDRLAPVGRCYNLPMVSIKDAIVPQYGQENQVIAKRQFFYDIYHPSNEGHRIMADCISKVIDIAESSEWNITDILTNVPAAIGDTYYQAKYFDRQNGLSQPAIKDLNHGSFCERDMELQYTERDFHAYGQPEFTNNWLHTLGVEEFVLQIFCKSLFLIYKDSGDFLFGKATIYADNKEFICDPHIINWTHCNAILLISEEVDSLHTVRIKINDASKRFTILGFGYCEE